MKNLAPILKAIMTVRTRFSDFLLEVWPSGCKPSVLKTEGGKTSVGSNPTASAAVVLVFRDSYNGNTGVFGTLNSCSIQLSRAFVISRRKTQ